MGNNKNKVGIITYYGNNYGGCLQAYAMQKTIQSIGYDANILQVNIQLKSYKTNIFSKVLRLLKNPMAYLKRKRYIKNYIKNCSLRSKAFDKFRTEFLVFDKTFMLSKESQSVSDKYNIFVCGSDQIWNPNLYGVHPIWTLKFAPLGSKKIAYAPSLGIATIPDKYVSDFRNNLQDFTFISCREQEGANSLAKVLNRQIDVVLDPTLLLTSEQWHVFAKPVNIETPYIFCYLFGDYDYIAEVKSKIKKHLKLNIVSLPYNLRELKDDDLKLYDITPNQFVWLIENAEYVITDSFHASVFSIKMNTPFVSLKRSSDNDIKNMNSRIYTLLHIVGLEDRMVGEDMIKDIEQIVDKLIDFKEANNKLEVYMKRDIKKLNYALSHE